jgi:hypothetical protein
MEQTNKSADALMDFEKYTGCTVLYVRLYGLGVNGREPRAPVRRRTPF